MKLMGPATKLVGGAATMATLATGIAVPEAFHLTATMKAVDFSKILLAPLDFTIGVQEKEAVSAEEAVMRNMGEDGAVLFVQLHKLSAPKEGGPAPLEGFNLLGVVKETGVDDKGLMDFYSQYYPFPLYRDDEFSFFKAMESGTFMKNMSWNPFKTWQTIQDIKGRMQGKDIKGNMKGDGIRSGGVLVFGQDGQVKYMYKESTGIPIDEEGLLKAVQAVRDEQASAKSEL
eukprot:Nitzschia sp. Nitz4//scaffold89_size161592//133406//134226//NITZ4_002397-RA/size161592-snap-gene-0.182-mRNA-1//-1//CDS//3329559673//3467//frame0